MPRLCRVAIWLLFAGCQRSPIPTATRDPIAPDVVADAAISTSPPSKPAECAEVRIGLDLRALPTPVTDDAIRFFNLGQADRFRSKAPEGSPLRILVFPGQGGMLAFFDGESSAAVARCERTVTAYLASAPHLPLTKESAASVTTACRPCEPET